MSQVSKRASQGSKRLIYMNATEEEAIVAVIQLPYNVSMAMKTLGKPPRPNPHFFLLLDLLLKISLFYSELPTDEGELHPYPLIPRQNSPWKEA